MKTQILGIVVLIAVAFVSCENGNKILEPSVNDENVLKSTQIAITDAAIENAVEAADYDVELLLKMIAHNRDRKGKIIKWHKGMRYQVGQCPNVAIDSSETGFPIRYTCDFGEETVLENGRVVAGTISIEISDPKGTDGATRTITYENFVVDSIGIEGTCVHTYNGDNETSRVLNWTSNLTFTMPDGMVVDRDGNTTRTWLVGIETPEDRTDDIIEITGNVVASDDSGASYSRAITEPLIRKGDCKYIVQGIVTISENGIVTSQLDYGDGECDSIVTITIGNDVKEIDIAKRKEKQNNKKS